MPTASRTALGSAVLMVSGLSIVVPSTTAAGDLSAFALNGTFTATSDGQWAKTNERFHDEATVTSTWTFTTACTTATDCSGRVTSDQGWSADVTYTDPLWYVTRTLDGWMTCPDGTTVPGTQIYKFFADQYDKPLYRGWDNTTGPSGACGVNKVLNIEMPFKLIPVN